jgi:hypothetical protein
MKRRLSGNGNGNGDGNNGTPSTATDNVNGNSNATSMITALDEAAATHVLGVRTTSNNNNNHGHGHDECGHGHHRHGGHGHAHAHAHTHGDGDGHSCSNKFARTSSNIDPSSLVPAPRISWDSLTLHDGEIGRGSAAYVKRADYHHPTNGTSQQVVVKILLARQDTDPYDEFVQRFWSEVTPDQS